MPFDAPVITATISPATAPSSHSLRPPRSAGALDGRCATRRCLATMEVRRGYPAGPPRARGPADRPVPPLPAGAPPVPPAERAAGGFPRPPLATPPGLARP